MTPEKETTKDEVFKLRMGEDDRALLEAVAKHCGESSATVIRRLVRAEADRIEGDAEYAGAAPRDHEFYYSLRAIWRWDSTLCLSEKEIEEKLTESGYFGPPWKGHQSLLRRLARAGWVTPNLAGGWSMTKKGQAFIRSEFRRGPR
jgi:hypothetical protein